MENNQQDSTIPTDVQNVTGDASDVQQTPETRPLSPREEALARIEQANMEQIDKVNDDYRKAHGEPEPTPDQGRPEIPEPVAADPGQTVRVKVDGQEMELPISEVVKGYQKDATADKRLKEAALRLQEIEAREAALAEAATRQIPSVQTDESLREKAQRIIDAMYEGDTSSAVESLVDAMSAGTPAASVVDDAKLMEAAQRALQQQVFDREFSEARDMFVKNHADLNNNPTLAAMVNQHYNAAIDAGHLPVAATNEAVRQVREFVSSLTGQAGVGSTNRQERKQNYDTITPAAGRVESGSRQADDNSPAAVIAQMRAARGQA